MSSDINLDDKSVSFRHFYESFSGARGYGWEPDIRALLKLQNEERILAENLLLEKLQDGDSEAAFGLGELRSVSAAPLLKQKLNDRYASMRIACALALWQIERYPDAAKVIIRCMKKTKPDNPTGDKEIDDNLLGYDLTNAVCALGQIALPDSAKAVAAALSHQQYVIRYNAARALSWLCGHTREIAKLQTALASNDISTKNEAINKILALVDLTDVKDDGPRDFNISFDPHAYEYIIYSEAGQEFYFHPDYSSLPPNVPTGDYLSGFLGKNRDFTANERERIIQRLETFLIKEKSGLKIVPTKHLSEPNRLAPSIGGKFSFQSMHVAEEVNLQETAYELNYDWETIAIKVAMSAIIYGGVGFLSWGLLCLYSNFFDTVWYGILLSSAASLIGCLLAWNKISKGAK
jgi:hypothetical protein